MPTNLRTHLRNYLHTYVPEYLRTYVPTYLHTYVPVLSKYFFGIIYVPMYSTFLPTYLRAYIPIVQFIALYLLSNYLRKSSNLLTYLLTYVHTYVTTYIHMYLSTFAPVLSAYHQCTYVPKLSTCTYEYHEHN
jgi:hypothetical protein